MGFGAPFLCPMSTSKVFLFVNISPKMFLSLNLDD